MPKQVYVINPIGSIMQDKLPVAAYCRVSSNSDDQRHSYYAQVKEYTEQIESNPEWLLAGIYADPGITGTSAAKRKEFQRLMKDCRAGKVKRILVKSVSRFARNTKECLEYVRELKALGVSVYFEDKKIDTASYSSEMMLAMFGSIAQEESVSISNNMRWSYEKRMQRGEFITANAPYGYYLQDGSLHINQEEADAVRNIFALFLEGLSTRAITEHLNLETHHPSGQWKYTTILYMLKNEKYVGDALLHKRPYYGTDQYHKLKQENRDMYYVSDSHPAIIDHDTFESAQALLKKREKPLYCNDADFALSKRVYCRECMSMARRKKLPSGHISWVCRMHDLSKHECPSPPVAEKAIEEAFYRLFRILNHNINEILLPMDNRLRKLREKTVQGNEGISGLDKTILTVNGQIHALNRLRSKGFMEPAVFQEKQNELAARLEKAQKQREMLLSDDKDDQSLERTEELIEILENAPENLASLEDSEVFSMMISKVLIDKNKKIIFRLINGLELVGDGGVADG